MNPNIKKLIGWGVALLVLGFLATGYFLMVIEVRDQKGTEAVESKWIVALQRQIQKNDCKIIAQIEVERAKRQMELERREQSFWQELKSEKEKAEIRLATAERDLILAEEMAVLAIRVMELEAKLATNQPWGF